MVEKTSNKHKMSQNKFFFTSITFCIGITALIIGIIALVNAPPCPAEGFTFALKEWQESTSPPTGVNKNNLKDGASMFRGYR